MDASRGKKMTTRVSAAARSVAVVGKENICPEIRREIVNASRSPLPEGFRRAPLQDITHILSPINVPLNDGDSIDLGFCKPQRKRSKCLSALDVPSSTSTCESEPHSADLEWRGLIKCGSRKLSEKVLRAEAESNHGGDGVLEESASEAGFVESAKTEALNVRDPAEAEHEERVQESVLMAAKSLRGEDKEREGEPNSKLPSFSKRRPHNSSSSPSTRSSLRSAQIKPKMSSLMKLR